MCISFFSLFFFFLKLTSFFDPIFVGMATRYSKDTYAHVKGMMNESLSQLAIDTKKHKLNKEKNEMIISSSIHTVPSSSTLSLEMMTVTPPTTHSKERVKLERVFGRIQLQPLGEPIT